MRSAPRQRRADSVSIVELADLEVTVEKDEVLRPAANKITAADRAAYEEKLAGPRPGAEPAAMAAARPVPTLTQKRMATMSTLLHDIGRSSSR